MLDNELRLLIESVVRTELRKGIDEILVAIESQAKGKNMPSRGKLLRISQVLEIIPVSRSTWWQGVKTGKFPKPVKLGERMTAWHESEVRALLKKDKGL